MNGKYFSFNNQVIICKLSRFPITADRFPTPHRQAATSLRQVTAIDVGAETAHHSEMRRARPRHGGAKHRTQMLPSSGRGKGGLARKQLRVRSPSPSDTDCAPCASRKLGTRRKCGTAIATLLEAQVRESDAP